MSDQDAIGAFCAELRQGDILTVSQIRVGDDVVECPDAVVIVSQTCDLVRIADRPNITVARAVRLSSEIGEAALRGKRPRWVPLSDRADGLFADLEMLASVPKASVVTLSVTRTFRDDEWNDQRRFAQRVGRRFTRLALPEDIVPWFSGLVDPLQSKAGKLASPLGRAIEMIAQIRVMADDWSRPGASVEVFLILEGGELPLLSREPDHGADGDDEMAVIGTLPGVAERLFPLSGERPTGSEREDLWWEFADVVRSTIVKAGPASPIASVREAISNVSVQISDETEFTLAQYRRSDELDLAHLSSPTTS